MRSNPNTNPSPSHTREKGAQPAAAGRGSTAAFLARTALLASIYIAFAHLGLRIHPIGRFATLVWAPTGISLAALLLFGMRLWPGITAGALIVNLWTGAPLPVAAGIAAGNTLEALFAALILSGIPGFRRSLDRVVDVVALLVIGGLFSTMISATIGTASLWLGGVLGPERVWVAWRAWWLGDAIGDFVLAPFLLTWAAAPRGRLRPARAAEASLLTVLLLAASAFVFELTRNGLAALLSPLLVWAAIRFDQRGAARATFLVSVIATWATTHGHGVFARSTVEEGLFAVQSFIALTAGTFLVLGAMTSERRRAEEERRLAGRAILESEERYRTLIDAVDQLIWINDASGKIRYVNQQWRDRLGPLLDDGEGLGWLSLVHPDDRGRVIEARSRAMEAREPYQAEYRFRTISGDYRWMLARVVPVKEESGSVHSWLGTAAEIHDLKLAEEHLRAAKEQAESANRAKDQFLAALSHELRTPLTPVLAFSSLLEREPRLSAETRRMLEIVRRNSELEARLIDDLLDLTSISRGKLTLDPEPVVLDDAIGDAVEICQPDAAEKGVRIDVEGHDSGVTVLADPARLRQIFWNLLKNAIKFTPPDGRIWIRPAAAADNRVAIEISDTGTGIEQSQLDRIFRPFEQASRGCGGLGLGLSISRALAEAHGGTLTGSSEGPGRGSTFRVELELAADAGAAAVARPRTGPAEAFLRRSVLVVEDHADTLRAECEILGELAFEVVGARSVAEALAATRTRSFDFVVSDLGLPDGTGVDLMRQLHDRHGLTGIAVTGYGMEEDISRSREAGFREHVVKPITFQRLASAIDRFLAARGEAGTPV